MNPVNIGVSVFAVGVFLVSFTSCTWVETNEYVLEIDLNAGKPVTPLNNPVLSQGIQSCFGVNCSFFSIPSTAVEIKLTGDSFEVGGATHKYDRRVSWDSIEVVSMETAITLIGAVTDPQAFYINYGTMEYELPVPDDVDGRIYAALIEAYNFVNVAMSEKTQQEKALDIRAQPDKHEDELKQLVNGYMNPKGFTVTGLIFDKVIQFPDPFIIGENGEKVNAIEAALNAYTALTTALEQIEQEIVQAQNTAATEEAEAKNAAKKILELAKRKVAAIKANTQILEENILKDIEGFDQKAALRLAIARVKQKMLERGDLIIYEQGSLKDM
jgi:hypothetical protein